MKYDLSIHYKYQHSRTEIKDISLSQIAAFESWYNGYNLKKSFSFIGKNAITIVIPKQNILLYSIKTHG